MNTLTARMGTEVKKVLHHNGVREDLVDNLYSAVFALYHMKMPCENMAQAEMSHD